MWLIRFHHIETRDYNKLDRILKDLDCLPKRVSTMLFIKGIVIHIVEKKSWRKIAEQLSIPYLSLYHFYNELKDRAELGEILFYFIDRQILLYIGEEKNITELFLHSNATIESSKKEIQGLLS